MESVVNFFKNVATTVKDKLAQINPIYGFIKFSMSKVLQDHFKNQDINLEGLLSGKIDLPDLELDPSKINSKYLYKSPFSLHSGIIKQTKITLPNIRKMDTQRIEVQIKNIKLQLKPIQNFEQNFIKVVEQIKQLMHLFVEEKIEQGALVEKGSEDNFKQFLKYYLANIKIRVENISIIVYLENPSQSNKKNPYFLLLKLPVINIHKGSEAQKPQSKNVQELKYQCEIPQLSLHIMDANKELGEGFPFEFPKANHPTTVLLFGIESFQKQKLETDQCVPRLKLSISKSIQLKQKTKLLEFQFPKFQLMVNPNQIRVLILFAKQINEFLPCLQKVNKEHGLGSDEENLSSGFPVLRKKSSRNKDVFTSISMSLAESEIMNFSKITHKKVKVPGMLDSMQIILKNDKSKNEKLLNEIQQFNKVLEQSINKKQATGNLNISNNSNIEKFELIDFDHYIEIKALVKSINICIQKFEVQKQKQRKWADSEEFISPQFSNSYFVLDLQKFFYHHKDLKNDKATQISFSKLNLEHIKKRSEKILSLNKPNSQILEGQEFFEMNDTKKYYSNSQSFVSLVNPNNHFCVHQVLCIHYESSQNAMKQNSKKYKFIVPKETQKINQMKRPGFHMILKPANNFKKFSMTKICLMDVEFSANSQLLKQVLDLYVHVSKELQNFSQFSQENKKEKAVEQITAERPINNLLISIRSVNASLIDSEQINYKSSVEKYMKSQKQSFDSCFCGQNINGVYFHVQAINFNTTPNQEKLDFRNMDFGLIYLENSLIKQTRSIMMIKLEINQKMQQKHFELSLCRNKKENSSMLYLTVPEIIINIEQRQTLECIKTLKKQLQFVKQPLQQIFNKSLSKGQKEQNLQEQQKVYIYVNQFRLKFISVELLIRNCRLSNEKVGLTVKISSLILATREPLQLFSGKMNLQQLQQIKYPEKQNKHDKIKDSSIILEIHKDITNQINLSAKDPKAYFENVMKSKSTIELLVFTNQNQKEQLKDSIHINVSAPIYINAVNIFRIINKKGQIDAFVKKGLFESNKLQILTSEVLGNHEVKMENDLQKESQHRQIVLLSGKVHIDIRPTFLELSAQQINQNQTSTKKVVFSTTRSFVSFYWNDLTINLNSKFIKGKFNLTYYFKTTQTFGKHDHFLIGEAQVANEGYVQVLCLKNLCLNLDFIMKKIRLTVGIQSIEMSSSLQTLAWLSLHWKHFMRHNIKCNFGLTAKQDAQRFQILDEDEFQFQVDNIVELDNGVEIFTDRMKRKMQLEKDFRQKQILPLHSDQHCEFYIQKFGVEKLKIRLTSKYDTQAEIIINVTQLGVSAKIPQLSNALMQIYGNVQTIEITHSNQTKEDNGILGGLYSWWYTNNYEKFVVLKNHSNLKFLFQKDQGISYLKFGSCSFDIGFRSVILEFVDRYTEIKEKIKTSGWKKVYEEKKPAIQPPLQQPKETLDNSKNLPQEPPQEPLVLIMIPQNRINVTLVYEGYSILSDCSINAPSFLLHEQSQNFHQIKNYVIDWIRRLLRNNVAGIVASTFIDKFELLVTQIIGLITFLVGSVLNLFR